MTSETATDTTPAKARRGKSQTATDTILLGLHGEIHAGETIPSTYVDSVGETQDTDFDRLSDLGLLA